MLSQTAMTPQNDRLQLVALALKRLPKLDEDQAQVAIDRAIHAGVLEVSRYRPDSLRAPIPSMLTYLALNRNAEAALQRMREACGQSELPTLNAQSQPNSSARE